MLNKKYSDLTSRYYCPNCGNKLKYENSEEALREYKEVEVKLNEYLKLHHPLKIRSDQESYETPRGDDSFAISFVD